MDSQAPNKAAEEWLLKGGFFPEDISVYRERKYGNSRFDLYIESPVRKAFMEVKGVTLEEDNIVRFTGCAYRKRNKSCAGTDPVHERRI